VSERREPSLLRAIGTIGLAAGIVNVTIGGGIFRLPAVVAGILGTQAPLAFLVCAAVMGLIVAGFAEAGRRVDLTGGPYAYVEVAFGSLAGFLAGVLVWLLGTTAVAAVATVFADSIGAMLPIASGAGGRAMVLVATFGLLATVNVLGVRFGTRLNAVATAAKLLPLSPGASRWRPGAWRAARCSSSSRSAASRAPSCRAARSATSHGPCRAPSRSPWWR
jgi:amino acid transporter